MKKIIALILTLVLCLGIAACNKQQAPAAPSTGSTRTSGNLTVFVPNGWTLVADEAKPDQVYICKGGSDLNTTPYVKLSLGGALPSKTLCTHVQDLEPQTCGQLTWNGFSGIRSEHRVIYLVTYTGSGSILATLWYNDTQLSLEEEAVRSILGGVSGTAADQPQSPVTDAVTETVVDPTGDWAGQVNFYDCSGDLEGCNGTTYTCIARFRKASDGSLTPYIGLPADCAPFTDLSAVPGGEGMAATLSGAWQDLPFEQATLELDQDTLETTVFVSTENGSAHIRLSLTATTEFEAKAAQLGCTGYPS